MASPVRPVYQPARPLHICFITGEYPPMQGGVGDYTRELALALTRLGHTVSVITSTRGSAQEPGITTYPIIERWDWRSSGKIIACARQAKADVLHIQYQTAAYGMHPAINFLPLRLRFAGKRPRTAVTYHDLRVPYLFPKAGRFRTWVTLGPARWCDATIATNVEDGLELNKHGLRFHLIPIGSNISTKLPSGYDRTAWRARLGIGPQDTLLCYFGFLNASKGGETLIQALGELSQENRNIKLLMVGGQVGDSDKTNAAYLAQTKKLIDDLRLGHVVLWTGFTSNEEVSANLVAADIAVLPYRDGASYRRGSLMAVINHGLPVITTNGPGTTSLSSVRNIAPETDMPCLSDCGNVMLVAPNDSGAITRGIIRLVANPALRQRLAASSRILAHDFNWDTIAARTSGVYDGITK